MNAWPKLGGSKEPVSVRFWVLAPSGEGAAFAHEPPLVQALQLPKRSPPLSDTSSPEADVGSYAVPM